MGDRHSCLSKKLRPNRIARDDRVLAFHPRHRFRKRDRDAGHESRNDAVGKAGKRVRFVNERRDAAQFRGGDHRPARIAADAEDKIRVVLLHERGRLEESARQAQDVANQIDAAFAFQSADVDELEREAGFRDDGLLESALGADEDDAAIVGIAPEPFARNGDGGINVAACATSRDHQCLHAHRPHPVFQFACCEKFSSNPIEIKLAISDVPP